MSIYAKIREYRRIYANICENTRIYAKIGENRRKSPEIGENHSSGRNVRSFGMCLGVVWDGFGVVLGSGWGCFRLGKGLGWCSNVLLIALKSPPGSSGSPPLIWVDGRMDGWDVFFLQKSRIWFAHDLNTKKLLV